MYVLSLRQSQTTRLGRQARKVTIGWDDLTEKEPETASKTSMGSETITPSLERLRGGISENRILSQPGCVCVCVERCGWWRSVVREAVMTAAAEAPFQPTSFITYIIISNGIVMS